MAYVVQEVGKTGPSERIGGSSPFHIDTKLSKSLPMTDHVKAFDAIAKEYGKTGRKIVFSNAGVSGDVWNLNATLEQKVDQLNRAAAAHSHNYHKDFHSYDYYAPIGIDRWDKSAEGAPIYVAGLPGMKVEGAQGGGWGNHGLVLNADGVVIGKTGHGDTNIPVFKGGILGGLGDVTDNVKASANKAVANATERAKNYIEMTGKELNTKYDELRKSDPKLAESEGMKMHKAYFNKQ